MTLRPDQLADAGFSSNGQTHALTLPNGNTLLIPSAYSQRATHFATEYEQGNPRQMVAVYYLENDEDLTAVAVGTCQKILCRARSYATRQEAQALAASRPYVSSQPRPGQQPPTPEDSPTPNPAPQCSPTTQTTLF